MIDRGINALITWKEVLELGMNLLEMILSGFRLFTILSGKDSLMQEFLGKNVQKVDERFDAFTVALSVFCSVM